MKIICVFLLAAAFAPFLAGGQTLPPSGQSVPSTRQPVPAIWQPLPGNNRVIPDKAFIFKQSSPPGVSLRTTRPDRIRFLRPDNMACRMTDLARLERMPVRRANNADPMNRLSAPFNRLAYGIK